MPDRWRSILVLMLLLLALQQGSSAALIQAKAWLAPVLIADAWRRSLEQGGLPVRPWPWADTWPVARLRVPGQGVDLFVLAGDSGNVLAFGPGWLTGSSPPGGDTTTIISGHRDTHFAFLRELKAGDDVLLQDRDGCIHAYRIHSARVADSRQESIALEESRHSLLLITCYPFDALHPRGPLRYVLRALPNHNGSYPIRTGLPAA